VLYAQALNKRHQTSSVLRDGAVRRGHRVDTLAGLIQPAVRADGYVAVDMGEPIFEPAKVNGPAYSTTMRFQVTFLRTNAGL
jgi:diaminopimelate epimerase